jgi:hypothetical protein
LEVPVYDVVVLVEQPVTDWDARQITALHFESADPVHYHVLMPVEDAASRVEATVGSLATSDMMAPATLYLDETDLDELDEEIREAGDRALQDSVRAFRQAGADADGELTADDPLDRLAALVRQRNTAEVVILTRSHLVAEMLHLDWTNRARRKLSVPILHLVAQEEPDWESEVEDEQAAEAQAGEVDDDARQPPQP